MCKFKAALAKQKSQNLFRERKIFPRSLLSFINNDYLGFSSHPNVIAAFQEGAKTYGVGASASPLLGGYHECHQILEQQLAHGLKAESALLFSSGFIANLAVIQTLVDKKEQVF